MINNKCIFFDRDGTLIKAPVDKKKLPKSYKTINQIYLDPEIVKICKILGKKYYLFMITNQPDIPRRNNSKINVLNINNFLKKSLNLTEVCTNFSDDEKNYFRKPNPGMIFYLKKKYNICLEKSFVIGDRWRDIDAGNNAGCKTIFIDHNYNEKINSKPTFIIKSFKEILKFVK
tara:strand:- start:3833 stop:4354 length:522 start_codon:yes stop_codon:yes gene_type:complete